MDYIRIQENGQYCFEETDRFLRIPCLLHGFTNDITQTLKDKNERTIFRFHGRIALTEEDRACPECGKKMHINNNRPVTLKHLNFGGDTTEVVFPHTQLRCPCCGRIKSQFISFKAEGHLITEQLKNYVCDLLATNSYTLKDIADMVGLDENTVKAIDKKRLESLYVKNGKLIKPEDTTTFLGIDEFKLHNGHRYATHIIDMETGHILWIGETRKKQVVYDFIDHVGLKWMAGVEAVACDMNSDFEEAFVEKCPHIQPVFDYFHVVKNFNDKVISEVRKDEQQRLKEAGDLEGAKSLKRSKYILTSSRETLRKKDEARRTEAIPQKSPSLFAKRVLVKASNLEARYDQLISENKLLFTCDLIKEKLRLAFRRTDIEDMIKDISEIISICVDTENSHFIWFAKMLNSHFDGIAAHADYPISAGKIEGINNRIKTLRRMGYGYPNDDYFFLKIFDMSRSGNHP